MKSFLIVAALLLSPFLSPPAAAEILEKVVVAVNGDIVTLSEFEGRQLAAVQGAQIAPEQIRGFLQQNNARLLQEAIDEMLIVQRGEELGFKVPPEALDQIIEERIKKENNIQSDAQLQQQLRREGMTLDDLKRQIERSIVHRQVLASDIPQPALTEAEMREYYETHLDDYARPASVNLQEIFISSTHPDAILRAQEMADRARDGEDFSVLARTNSDAPSAENGGDLGTLVLGEINPDIERVATALPPGGISEPRRTADGYQILRVVEKTEAATAPFGSAKEEIRRELTSRQRLEGYNEYVADLRKNATIDIRVREVGLQVDASGGPTLSDDARQAGAAQPPEEPPVEDDEFSVSGSQIPTRGGPGSEAPQSEEPVTDKE